MVLYPSIRGVTWMLLTIRFSCFFPDFFPIPTQHFPIYKKGGLITLPSRHKTLERRHLDVVVTSRLRDNVQMSDAFIE